MSVLTEQELDYLDHIGTYSQETQGLHKGSLLTKYLNASLARVDWDGLDKLRIITHCAKLLEENPHVKY